MKCIENISNGKIARVSDGEADDAVRGGLYRYASKSDWRDQVQSNLAAGRSA